MSIFYNNIYGWCPGGDDPSGVFTAAGAGVKTNLLFFTKGRPTHQILFYDLSDLKIGKKTPLTLKHFEDFFRLLPTCADSDLSWTVNIDERRLWAAEEARPFKEQAIARSQQAAQISLHIAELKKAPLWDMQAIEQAETQVKELMSISTRKCSTHLHPYRASDIRQPCTTFATGLNAKWVNCKGNF